MKWLVGALLGVFVLAIAIVLVPSDAPMTGPEPILYGRDACARCRMHLSRPGFAGELRDRKGVLTKYDDLGCLLVSMWALHAEVPEAWVEDHDTGELSPLLAATFVTDARLATPMSYGILAFATSESATHFVEQHGGTVTTLESILADPKRFRHEPGAEHVHAMDSEK